MEGAREYVLEQQLSRERDVVMVLPWSKNIIMPTMVAGSRASGSEDQMSYHISSVGRHHYNMGAECDSKETELGSRGKLREESETTGTQYWSDLINRPPHRGADVKYEKKEGCIYIPQHPAQRKEIWSRIYHVNKSHMHT